MKKLLTIAALLAAASLSYGQGYVQFANGAGTRFSTNTPSSATGTGFVTVAVGTTVGQFYFELFAAPSTQNTISTATDPTLNGWTAVHIGTNTTQGGRFIGNDQDSGNAIQAAGFASGTTADFAVAGWSSALGTSWAQAQAWWNNGLANGSVSGSGPVYFGISSTIGNDIPLAVFQGNYNTPFGTVPGTINGFGLSYYPVPEPSTFALAGLGAAALLIFRRRKA